MSIFATSNTPQSAYDSIGVMPDFKAVRRLFDRIAAKREAERFRFNLAMLSRPCPKCGFTAYQDDSDSLHLCNHQMDAIREKCGDSAKGSGGYVAGIDGVRIYTHTINHGGSRSQAGVNHG